MVENEEERGKKITHSLPYPVRSHQSLKKREEKIKEKKDVPRVESFYSRIANA